MVDISKLDAEGCMSEETFDALYDVESDIDRQRYKIQLRERAKRCGVPIKDFDALVKSYDKALAEYRKAEKAEKKNAPSVVNYTNFGDTDKYPNMLCGSWLATEDGVFALNSSSLDDCACYHPILPVSRLKNLETGEEQITLAYKRNNAWTEITVPKVMTATASRIVGLAAQGVAVTSENAKLLVRYLADVENLNDDYIRLAFSTSKLGWHGNALNEFIPYDETIEFDGDNRFRQLYASVKQPRGSYEKWLSHMKQIRKRGRLEVKLLMAASFASVLLRKIGSLTFFVDLWGTTEGGKTVTEMVAASIWGNPSEGWFLGDFKSTDTALEAKADMLSDMPMILDDTSKVSKRIKDNFESLVYDLCSGKGKTRSNKELGVNRENNWSNIIICSGERPLSSYVSQGGAINRILELECSENVFENPQETADLVKSNYGMAGRKFVEIVQNYDHEELMGLFKDFEEKLRSNEHMDKQVMSLAAILTADKIATDGIFQDGVYISIQEAKKTLTSRSDVSDGLRCFRYLQDIVNGNEYRFNVSNDDDHFEKWGVWLTGGWIGFFPKYLDQICKEGEFNRKAFTSWAIKNGIVQRGNEGRDTIVSRIEGRLTRIVKIDIEKEISDNIANRSNYNEYCENNDIEFD